MAQRVFKSVTADGRTVYDLDAIDDTQASASKALTSLAATNQLAFQSASAALTGIMPGIQQMIASFEPIRQVAKTIVESFNKMWEDLRETIAGIIKPLSFLLSTQPIYLVREPRPVVVQEERFDRYLAIANNEYEFFVIDGKKLNIMHPASSRCGRLLATLLEHRAEIVDYQTLKEKVRTQNLDKDFKDLKYQLKQSGYKLDYSRPRTVGIALAGLRKLQ